MLTPPSADPVWIATAQDLRALTKYIADEPVLAIDTESNSLFAYREHICLVQLSTPAADYLIDPLAIQDLSPLAPLFANPSQLKIFHAAEYDVICLKRDYGFEISNIFDTMIAARILGEPQVGLGPLLTTYFGLQLDKRLQRADWGKRPLTPHMLDYARMDTHYLFNLKVLLEEKLIEADLLDLAVEDFHLVSQVSQSVIEPNGNSCWKVSGGAHLSSRETAILQSLCNYRDQYAQQVNLPHFKVLSNDLLIALSQQAPHTLQELQQVPGISERLMKKHAEGLLSAVAKGENATPPVRHHRQRPDKAFLARLNSLHDWRKTEGKKRKVESDVILPRDYMEKIATQNPSNLDELKELMIHTPWRYEHFGAEIFQLIRPKGAL